LVAVKKEINMNKIFISWSGEPSKTLALALSQWLPNVLHTVDIWVSSDSIRPGDRWTQEITTALSEIHFGIICVTELNQTSPWMNFEAGALSKTLNEGQVCPYLINVLPSELSGPLSLFQSSIANKSGTFKLIQSINSILDYELSNDRLRASFEKWWPDFELALNDLPEPAKETSTSSNQWPLVKTVESLTYGLSKLSIKQRIIFREILKSDNRLNSNIYSDFFKSFNRIGGHRVDGLYPNMLIEVLNLNRDEVVYRCKDLNNEELISITPLTDLCFRATESVVRITNKFPQKILTSLYTLEERNGSLVEDHYGGILYKDGKPDIYTDIDGRPLEGVFRIDIEKSLGIYTFKKGKIVGSQE